jgi:hypothetical protein
VNTAPTREDHIEVYQGANFDWWWRRVSGHNGQILSTSGEGYRRLGRAIKAAKRANPDCHRIDGGLGANA